MARKGPTAAALHEVTELLTADTGSSHKAILLVTDGGGDYCDSVAQFCAADTTVRVIQDAHTAGIETLVATFGGSGPDGLWSTAMANAGVGNAASAPRDPSLGCSALPTETAAILSDIDPNVRPMASYENTMGPTEPIALGSSEDMTETLVDAITNWAACDEGS